MPHYDYDKEYPFAAFITNLGKYNEGALVGEWMKFPTTAEELKKVFERIGIGAKDDFGQTYEEWFITDYIISFFAFCKCCFCFHDKTAPKGVDNPMFSCAAPCRCLYQPQAIPPHGSA